ncbi:hypothetical protein [Legionella quateirensis]|uniref:Dot/Icm T4SS effector n=1 Tax=Legionella quateirensis TaxID=45072 RepID=A0A378KN18_9GAMM|nr:hypothetical protein [Legionella quateirensis]KTD52956.1 Dot/Icm T4SS effector [Legionella quateirensis]STY16314.1 Dot/Icm T4SS effector [Legionella quateirensis]
MKLLIDIVKSQIQQLRSPALKVWLLKHFNEDSDSLTDFFSRQIPVNWNKQHAQSISNIQFPAHYAIFPIVASYAPEELRQQLGKYLIAAPELHHDVEGIDNSAFSSQICNQLKDFSEAWPVITALQKQGPDELIQVLEQSSEPSLRALARLNHDPNVQILLDVFFSNNNKELEAIKRNSLFQFLRQPDFSGWFTRYLDSYVNQATDMMSLRFLLLIFSPGTNELDKLTELRASIDAYPFPLHLETLWAICSYYQSAFDPDTSVALPFIMMIHDLLKKMDSETQIEFLNGLNPIQYFLIVDYCLKNTIQGGMEEHQMFMELLFLFCYESSVPDKQCLMLIQNRLIQPEDILFKTHQIPTSAKSLPAKSVLKTEGCFGGSMIEQLLVSADFVATSSSELLKQLIDRYTLLSLTLSQTEFNKNILVSDESNSNTAEFKEHLKRINLRLLKQSEPNEDWLAKRFKTLKMCIEYRVNALLFQLEEHANQRINQGKEHGEQALRVLYNYYSQMYPSLRFDLLIRAIETHYQKVRESVTILSNDPNQTLQSFNLYGSQVTIERVDLERKRDIGLYNSVGQKIGFINDTNEAITYVNEEPLPLIQTGAVQENEPLFDQSGRVIGYLSESGQVRSAGQFQKEFSVRILGTTPELILDKSPAGLALLLQHVLFENSLNVFYGLEGVTAGSPKVQWFERRMSTTVEHLAKDINPATLESIVNHFSDDEVFGLLANIRHKTNAIQLFHSILNHDKKRAQLFSGLYEADVHQFLGRHNVVWCLAEYMAKYYDKPWFAEGLSRFAFYAKKNKLDNVLSDSLALLFKELGSSDTKAGKFDALLHQLIVSEDCAALVLKEFLNDRSLTAVQQVKNPEISRVTQYFNKKHLVATIPVLNKTSFWEGTAQYKFVLHVLEQQHAVLFPKAETPSSAKVAWQKSELDELAKFTNRHLSKKRSLDSDSSIGHKILGELIFRSARLGQTSLFYSKKKFNKTLARLSFSRVYLEKLVEKFWIPDGIKEQIAGELPRIKEWFRAQLPLNKELKDHQVLLDWRHLIYETWKEINTRKLPLICAYLLNYSGQKKSVLQLLEDYFDSFQNNTEYLHPVSGLLQQFPQRDISFVVFDALEEAMIKNPQKLDLVVLRDMAQFYAKKIINNELKSPQAELSLLTYFGQNKQYELARQGCELLAKTCTDKELKKRLLKGATEAEVEGSLHSSISEFYFGLLKTIKRLWHYGIFAEQSTSKIVKLCDDHTPGFTRRQAADEVNIPKTMQMNSECLGFNVKRKQLIGLLDTVKRSPVINTVEIHRTKSKQTLFGCAQEIRSLERKEVVASQNGMITI